MPTPTSQPPSPLDQSRQLLVVKAADWQHTTAELQCFSRPSTAADWQTCGQAIPVCLGRAGLAWGNGLHPSDTAAKRHKREGDACSPAGIFAITELFGSATADSLLAGTARLPYHCTTPDLKAIDDPASAYYNQIIDQRAVATPDWNSCEEMRRDDERYAIGAVIAHNAAPPLPGAGSCIFLHVWQAPGIPTAGCTAGALADILAICRWLDGAKFPLLVQLPLTEYQHFQKAWALP